MFCIVNRISYGALKGLLCKTILPVYSSVLSFLLSESFGFWLNYILCL